MALSQRQKLLAWVTPGPPGPSMSPKTEEYFSSTQESWVHQLGYSTKECLQGQAYTEATWGREEGKGQHTLVLALPGAGHWTKPLTSVSLNLLVFPTRLKIPSIPCLTGSLWGPGVPCSWVSSAIIGCYRHARHDGDNRCGEVFSPTLPPSKPLFQDFQELSCNRQALTPRRTRGLLNWSDWEPSSWEATLQLGSCVRPNSWWGFGFLDSSVETPWGILLYEIPSNLESQRVRVIWSLEGSLLDGKQCV